MEEQISRANRARVEAVQKKQKVDQDFNNIKKSLKTVVLNAGIVCCFFKVFLYVNNQFYLEVATAPDFDDNVLQDVSSSAEPPEKKKDKSAGRRVGLRGSGSKANKN